MTGYYDIVLGLIPLSLAGLTGVLFAAGVAVPIAVGLAAVVTVGLMGHAMFVNAPVSASPGAPATSMSGDAGQGASADSKPGNGFSAD